MNEFGLLLFSGVCVALNLCLLIKLLRTDSAHKSEQSRLARRIAQVVQEREQLAARLQALEVTESTLTPVQQRAVALGLASIYDGQLNYHLDALEQLAKSCPNSEFEELLRGLAAGSHNGRLRFTNGVSYSSIYHTVEELKDAVLAVRITARPAPINDTILRKCIVFELLFAWGTVELAGLWSAWQRIRADELFTAVGEFLQHGLAPRMTILQPDGPPPRHFAMTPENGRQIVWALLNLADHRHYIMGEIGEWAEELKWNFKGTTKYRAELAARIARMKNPPPGYSDGERLH